MSWYAVDGIDEAVEETRSFLAPVSVRRWAKLALVSVFVATGGGSAVGLFNAGSSVPSGEEVGGDLPVGDAAGSGGPTTAAGGRSPTELLETVPIDPTVAVAVVAALAGIVLGLRLVSAVLRMVLYDALHTDRVALVEPAGRRFGQALGLFGVTLGLDVAAVAPVVAVGAAVFAPTPVGPLSVLAGGVLAALVFLVVTVLKRVTREFVVPTMIVTDAGVLDGWRRFWPVFRDHLPQFGVYLVVHFLLLLAAGTVRSVLAGIVYLTVLVAGGVVGLGIAVGVFGGVGAAAASTAGLVGLGVVAAAALLVGWTLLLPVRVVLLAFVTTYEVSVLAAADADLRLRPRADDAPSDAAVTD